MTPYAPPSFTKLLEARCAGGRIRPRCACAFVIALAVAAGAWGMSDRDRALLEAARRGDAARVEALVREGADVNAATSSGLTALIEAAAAGRTEVARRLLEAGSDPDARHRERGTALDAAQRGGHHDLVRLLRRHGAPAAPAGPWGTRSASGPGRAAASAA